MSDTWHSTKTLCERLGVTPERLREYRDHLDLVSPDDWRPHHQDKRSIIYSPGAFARLAAHAAGVVEASAVGMPADEKDAPPSQPDAGLVIEEMQVASSPRMFPGRRAQHFNNPRVIKARRANGDFVYVRVPDSAHFVPQLRDGSPMTLRARLDGEPPIWTLVGRCPRAPGRW